MNKVVTINLNGRAYQLEDAGYEVLRNYLDQAAEKLNDNPDRDEIMNDLEQAIADKSDGFLNVHKTVILEKEVNQILRQMGPVEPEVEQEEKASDKKESSEKSSQTPPKRLYQIREGAVITGVCKGLAAYFDMDVTWVRLGFVVFTFITSGFGILVYFVMSLIVPYANTAEQKAAAHGAPFNAQELVQRVKERYSHMDEQYWKSQEKKWKNWAEDQGKQWETRWNKVSPEVSKVGSTIGSGIGTLFRALIIAFFSILWIFCLFSLITTGALFGFIFFGIPLWVLLVGITFLYHIVLLPFRSMSSRQNPSLAYDPHHGWSAMWDALMWFAFFSIIGWVVWTYVPGVQGVWEKFSLWVQGVIAGM